MTMNIEALIDNKARELADVLLELGVADRVDLSCFDEIACAALEIECELEEARRDNSRLEACLQRLRSGLTLISDSIFDR